VFVVTLALAMTLGSLLRITTVLRGISEMELSSLHKESALHGASWSLDVTMRRHERACRIHVDDQAARRAISAQRARLAAALEGTPNASQTMQRLARGWLSAARVIDTERVCEGLNRPELQAGRAQLDEQMTDLWATRLNELHAGLEEKEEIAQGIGKRAVVAGSVLSLGSFFLALILARSMARSVNMPLKRLGEAAARVGRGRFDADLDVGGPLEIVSLADELGRMQRQLAELDTLKQGFLASVSHELRTPLSKIRESLALLKDGVVGELDARQLRLVQIARVACEREIRMVTTLLDISRLRTGSPLLIREGISLDAVIESAVADEMDEAKARKVTIEMDVQPPQPVGAFDPVLLERAFANLVRNAVSVSPVGARVRVERRVVDDPKRGGLGARVRVVDQGPGVPLEIRETVFQAFVTSAVPKSPKALGVGLGLALAREVVCAHGGDLLLEDTESGATFELWLPLNRPTDERVSVSTGDTEWVPKNERKEFV